MAKQLEFTLELAGEEHKLEVIDHSPQEGSLELKLDGRSRALSYRVISPHLIQLTLGEQSHLVRLAPTKEGLHLALAGAQGLVSRPVKRRTGGGLAKPPPEVTPSMPAVVVRVLVAPGDQVEQGQAVVVVSAMKMESTLQAPRSGTVGQVSCREGDKVSPGEVLVTVDPPGAADQKPQEAGDD